MSYIICGTPHSGSTLLCEMLAASGVAGRPAPPALPSPQSTPTHGVTPAQAGVHLEMSPQPQGV